MTGKNCNNNTITTHTFLWLLIAWHTFSEKKAQQVNLNLDRYNDHISLAYQTITILGSTVILIWILCLILAIPMLSFEIPNLVSIPIVVLIVSRSTRSDSYRAVAATKYFNRIVTRFICCNWTFTFTSNK